MSDTNNESNKVSFEIPNVRQLTKKRSTIQVMFGLVFLLFFFNFFTIKCNDTKLVSLSGMNLVTGTDIKDQLAGPLKDFGKMAKNVDDQTKETKKEDKIPPNFFAILALATIVIGAGILFIKNNVINLIATICAGIAFISLILLRVTFGDEFQDQANEMISISIGINFAYWLALVILAATTYFSYVRYDKWIE
jgi:hypothetical protein